MKWVDYFSSFQAVFFFSVAVFCCAGIVYFLYQALRKGDMSYGEIAAVLDQPQASSVKNPGDGDRGFFTSQAQRLNLSFYLSLVFSLIGVLIIVMALLAPEAGHADVYVSHMAAAFAIEVVALAFFISSLRAHRYISEVLEADRNDRITEEINGLLSQITDSDRRDQLIAQLVLRRFPGVPTRAY